MLRLKHRRDSRRQQYPLLKDPQICFWSLPILASSFWKEMQLLCFSCAFDAVFRVVGYSMEREEGAGVDGSGSRRAQRDKPFLLARQTEYELLGVWISWRHNSFWLWRDLTTLLRIDIERNYQISGLSSEVLWTICTPSEIGAAFTALSSVVEVIKIPYRILFCYWTNNRIFCIPTFQSWRLKSGSRMKLLRSDLRHKNPAFEFWIGLLG